MPTTTPENLPFDPLHDASQMAALIGRVTGEPPAVVHERLAAEARWPGSTVASDFKAAGLRPYEWGEGLAAFYGRTTAFLYELAVWNRSWLKVAMRWRIGRYLARAGRPLDVLSVGDGLGFDTAAFARAGHRVTYFELPGQGPAFARELFAEAGLDVRVVTDPAELAPGGYDAVTCLDVLEHSPDPPASVRQFVGWLRPGGVAVINAPFFLLLWPYPTHLRANRRYSGSLRLYHDNGVVLHDGDAAWCPLVFRKPGAACAWRGNVINRALVRLVGPFLSVGRVSAWPFVGCHVLRWLTTRRFPSPALSGPTPAAAAHPSQSPA